MWGSLGLAEVNTLQGGDGPAEFTGAADQRSAQTSMTQADRDRRRRRRPGLSRRHRPLVATTSATASGNRFRRRRASAGWIAKILLLGLADAIAVVGMITAIDKEAWGYATVLGAAFVALNVVYLPRRFIPMKYLLPGLLLLAVFGIYPVLYTAYSSLTNYGTGHVLSRSQAIAQIQSQSVAVVEGATRYDVTPLKGPDGAFAGFGLYEPGVRPAVPRHRYRADRARRIDAPNCRR